MFCNWGSSFWNPTEHVLEAEVFLSKTGTIEELAHCRHKDNWKLDVIVTLMLMLICDPNCEDQSLDPEGKEKDALNKFMFPCLQTVQQKGVTSKMNSWIAKVRKRVMSLSNNAATHDIRYGVVHDCNEHEDLDLLDIFFRGGWSFEGETSAFSYANRRHGIMRAMRALNGYHDLEQIVAQLSMDEVELNLSEVEKKQFMNFEASLFSRLPNSSKPGDLLYSFRRVLMAVLLEKLPEILDDLKKMGATACHDVLFDVVKRNLHTYHFGMNDFKSWSKLVSFCRRVLI